MNSKNVAILLFLSGILIVTALGCQPGSEPVASRRQQDAIGASAGRPDQSRRSNSLRTTARSAADLELMNGNPFQFEPAEYSGTWLDYKHDNVIRVYVMDANGAKPVRLKVGSLNIFGSDGAIFSLDPEDIDSTGQAASYSLDNGDLVIAMNQGVELVMEVADRTYRARIPGTQD